MNKKNYQKTLVAWLTITTVVAVLGVASSFYFRAQLLDGQNTLENQIGNLQIKNERILFCYQNQVPNCDDASIKAWNAAHPADAFNLNARY